MNLFFLLMFDISSVLGGSCVGCQRDAIKGAERVLEEGREWTRSEKEVIANQDWREEFFNPKSFRFHDGKWAEELMRANIEAQLKLKQAAETERLSTLEGQQGEFDRRVRVRTEWRDPKGIIELEKSSFKVQKWMDENIDSDHPPSL